MDDSVVSYSADMRVNDVILATSTPCASCTSATFSVSTAWDALHTNATSPACVTGPITFGVTAVNAFSLNSTTVTSFYMVDATAPVADVTCPAVQFCDANTATLTRCDPIAWLHPNASTIAALVDPSCLYDAESSNVTVEHRLVLAGGALRSPPYDVFVGVELQRFALQTLSAGEAVPGASFQLQVRACNAFGACSPALSSTPLSVPTADAGITGVTLSCNADHGVCTVSWRRAVPALPAPAGRVYNVALGTTADLKSVAEVQYADVGDAVMSTTVVVDWPTLVATVSGGQFLATVQTLTVDGRPLFATSGLQWADIAPPLFPDGSVVFVDGPGGAVVTRITTPAGVVVRWTVLDLPAGLLSSAQLQLVIDGVLVDTVDYDVQAPVNCAAAPGVSCTTRVSFSGLSSVFETRVMAPTSPTLPTLRQGAAVIATVTAVDAVGYSDVSSSDTLPVVIAPVVVANATATHCDSPTCVTLEVAAPPVPGPVCVASEYTPLCVRWAEADSSFTVVDQWSFVLFAASPSAADVSSESEIGTVAVARQVIDGAGLAFACLPSSTVAALLATVDADTNALPLDVCVQATVSLGGGDVLTSPLSRATDCVGVTLDTAPPVFGASAGAADVQWVLQPASTAAARTLTCVWAPVSDNVGVKEIVVSVASLHNGVASVVYYQVSFAFRRFLRRSLLPSSNVAVLVCVTCFFNAVFSYLMVLSALLPTATVRRQRESRRSHFRFGCAVMLRDRTGLRRQQRDVVFGAAVPRRHHRLRVQRRCYRERRRVRRAVVGGRERGAVVALVGVVAAAVRGRDTLQRLAVRPDVATGQLPHCHGVRPRRRQRRHHYLVWCARGDDGVVCRRVVRVRAVVAAVSRWRRHSTRVPPSDAHGPSVDRWRGQPRTDGRVAVAATASVGRRAHSRRCTGGAAGVTAHAAVVVLQQQ